MKKNYLQPQAEIALLALVDVLGKSPTDDPYGDDGYYLGGENLL